MITSGSIQRITFLHILRFTASNYWEMCEFRFFVYMIKTMIQFSRSFYLQPCYYKCCFTFFSSSYIKGRLHGSLHSTKFMKSVFSECLSLFGEPWVVSWMEWQRQRREEQEWQQEKQGHLAGKWRGLQISYGCLKTVEYKVEPPWLIVSLKQRCFLRSWVFTR